MFRAGLPHRYRTLDNNPSNYIPSTHESDQVWIGNSFDYTYNIVYANQAFDDAYFNFVPTISIPCRVTGYQQYYNTQHSRSLNITDNICIEANGAEYWLAQNAPSMLGVDTTKYTVFLVNWYGRPDFRFHTYLPFSYPDPDPDTGFTFANFQPSETIAWGGTTPDDEQNGFGSLSRVWFYDLSAGPEWNTANYLLDPAELVGLTGFYTMPPIWEYGNNSAYRPFNDLSGDLAKIMRYVALDGLFTKSAIYPPALSPPKLPTSIQFDIGLYQVDQSWSLHNYIKPDRLVSEHAKLRPYNTQTATVTDLPFGNRQAEIYQCGRAQMFQFIVDPNSPATSCYGNRGDENYLFLNDFFLYHRDHENQFIKGNADFEVPIFIYGIPNTLGLPFSGFTDDDHYYGRSSFIYCDLSNSRRQITGMTHTATHEGGHYMGLAHPHDGFDYEDFAYWDPTELSKFYMWTGDESDTIMSYINLSNNFSQFDRDNMNRYMTAIYINQANKILPIILSSPRAKEITPQLLSADSDAGQALTSYATMNYLNAAVRAKSAYDKVLAAAASISVRIEPEALPADYRRHVISPARIDRPEGQQRPNLPLANDQNVALMPIR
jgi:hypothetical protein